MSYIHIMYMLKVLDFMSCIFLFKKKELVDRILVLKICF